MTWKQLDDAERELLRHALTLVDDVWKTEADALINKLQPYEPSDDDEKFRSNASVSDHHVVIDGDAVVSASDDGAYVMAWVWVSNAEAGIEEPHEDGCPAIDGFGCRCGEMEEDDEDPN